MGGKRYYVPFMNTKHNVPTALRRYRVPSTGIRLLRDLLLAIFKRLQANML